MTPFIRNQKAKITEIFKSIQGEGLYVGEEQVFVRFFGCNLSCGFCDTPLSSYEEYDLFAVLGKIKCLAKKYSTISFTGGEPLLQRDFLKDLLVLTHLNGYRNYLETNGILFEEFSRVIDDVDVIAMDFKLPSSTGLPYFWDAHQKFLDVGLRKKKDILVKSVICDSTKTEDIICAISVLKSFRDPPVYIFTPDSRNDRPELREKIKTYKKMCENEGIWSSIVPQLHKAIGVK